MPKNTPTLYRVTRTPKPTVNVVAIVAVVFFGSGYLTSTILNERRVRDRAAEQFIEFISVGTGLGVVTVDRQKLAELECIVTEAEWEEDDDVEQRQE